VNHEPNVYPQDIFWLHHRIDILTKFILKLSSIVGMAFTEEEMKEFENVVDFDDGGDKP
jgi:hypothetical protein